MPELGEPAFNRPDPLASSSDRTGPITPTPTITNGRGYQDQSRRVGSCTLKPSGCLPETRVLRTASSGSRGAIALPHSFDDGEPNDQRESERADLTHRRPRRAADPRHRPHQPHRRGACRDGLGPHPGQRIGPYTLIRQIGRGGVGVVWLAEQMEPIRRSVALKLIRASSPDPSSSPGSGTSGRHSPEWATPASPRSSTPAPPNTVWSKRNLLRLGPDTRMRHKEVKTSGDRSIAS